MGKLETIFCNLKLETPLIAVSGVFGLEYYKILSNIKDIGAAVTKSITLKPQSGNPEPRIIETKVGLLNSIGIQNEGLKYFKENYIPSLRIIEVPKIVSIAGFNIKEYVECASSLDEFDEVDALELNVSCPNIDKGGIEFGCDPKILLKLVSKVRKVVKNKTLIVKLTPNVADIALIARAAIEGGTDAISLINTVRGMAIDLNTYRPKLGNRYGGLSGEAIFPLAVYSVYRCWTSCCKDKNIPIIGIGGVSSGEDALELILAGATCVGIGTALFRNESVFKDVADFLRNYLVKSKIKSISDLVGKASD